MDGPQLQNQENALHTITSLRNIGSTDSSLLTRMLAALMQHQRGHRFGYAEPYQTRPRNPGEFLAGL